MSAPQSQQEYIDTYICLAIVKGKATWQIMVTGKSLEKIQKHLKEEIGAKLEELKFYKVGGKEGTIGRYFPN